jgi:PhnB protein
VPQGVTPYLLYEDTNAAIEWLVAVFGFREVARIDDSGVATHAELELEGGTIFLGYPGPDYQAPAKVGVTVGIHCYVADVDAHYERARDAGAKVLKEPHEPGYGDRRYDVEDPECHSWFFATPLEKR